MENPKPMALEQVQQVYLELLAEFDGICREAGLRYDLCGGSLLGAVRHGGFIPWDNDIDVSMPRPDYERLLAMSLAGSLELPAHRQVVSNRDGTFARHFSRYVRHDVRRITDMAEDWDCPYIGIDIFPLDGVSGDDRVFARQVGRLRQLRRLLMTSVERSGTSRRGKAAAFVKDLYRPVLRLIGSCRIARMMDRTCRRTDYESAGCVGIISGMYGKRERWRKADMLPRRRFDFAGLKVWGFANYDIYLTNLYGDYMKLPPKEQQVPHCDSCCRVEI